MKTESDLPDALCTSEQDPLTPWLVFLMNERFRSKRRFCWTSTRPSAAGLSSFFVPPFASNMKVCKAQEVISNYVLRSSCVVSWPPNVDSHYNIVMRHNTHVGITLEHIPRCAQPKAKQVCASVGSVLKIICHVIYSLQFTSSYRTATLFSVGAHPKMCSCEMYHKYTHFVVVLQKNILVLRTTSMECKSTKHLPPGCIRLHISRCAQAKPSLYGETSFSANITFTSGVPKRPFAVALQTAILPPIFASLS